MSASDNSMRSADKALDLVRLIEKSGQGLLEQLADQAKNSFDLHAKILPALPDLLAAIDAAARPRFDLDRLLGGAKMADGLLQRIDASAERLRLASGFVPPLPSSAIVGLPRRPIATEAVQAELLHDGLHSSGLQDQVVETRADVEDFRQHVDDRLDRLEARLEHEVRLSRQHRMRDLKTGNAVDDIHDAFYPPEAGETEGDQPA